MVKKKKTIGKLPFFALVDKSGNNSFKSTLYCKQTKHLEDKTAYPTL